MPMFDETPVLPTLAVIGTAVAGFVIGGAWLLRVARSDPERDHHGWRYRDRDRAATERIATTIRSDAEDEPMVRGRRGRVWGRLELILAAGVVFVVAPLVWLATPLFPGLQPRADLLLAAYGLAAVGLVGGFAWMVRIHRADPEPQQRTWRYRERD
jgi:hypothetical protein